MRLLYFADFIAGLLNSIFQLFFVSLFLAHLGFHMLLASVQDGNICIRIDQLSVKFVLILYFFSFFLLEVLANIFFQCEIIFSIFKLSIDRLNWGIQLFEFIS